MFTRGVRASAPPPPSIPPALRHRRRMTSEPTAPADHTAAPESPAPVDTLAIANDPGRSEAEWYGTCTRATRCRS